MEQKREVNPGSAESRLRRVPKLSRGAACLVAVLAFGALLAPCYAEDPKPDPAGVATGDRSTAVDGGGTSFMVSAPTDKSDPDFAKKQKEYEEFQAQSAKEPLAIRLPIRWATFV